MCHMRVYACVIAFYDYVHLACHSVGRFNFINWHYRDKHNAHENEVVYVCFCASGSRLPHWFLVRSSYYNWKPLGHINQTFLRIDFRFRII